MKPRRTRTTAYLCAADVNATPTLFERHELEAFQLLASAQSLVVHKLAPDDRRRRVYSSEQRRRRNSHRASDRRKRRAPAVLNQPGCNEIGSAATSHLHHCTKSRSRPASHSEPFTPLTHVHDGTFA
ncbi:unnamed protein product [Parajaminaea phylloscopi]